MNFFSIGDAVWTPHLCFEGSDGYINGANIRFVKEKILEIGCSFNKNNNEYDVIYLLSGNISRCEKDVFKSKDDAINMVISKLEMERNDV
jgi:hypothetical protein